MDDLGLAAGFCFGLVPGLLGLIFALVAKSKADRAARDVDAMAHRLEGTEVDIKSLRVQLAVERSKLEKLTTAAPATEPKPDVPPITAPPPEVAAEPEPPKPFQLPVSSAVLAEVAAQAEAAPKPEPAAPPPPEPPTAPPPPRAPPPAPAQPIEWEKWIGVRGAAVLGGIVFALAGLYLFRYSVAQGWISPAVRVVMATLAGIGALVGSQRLRAKYEVTSNALSAGGIVVLYAGFWAARVMYELIPFPAAFVLMVLTTAVAGLLAVKQGNRLAAYLGLVGGFATPILLSTHQNSPIGLFSYVFVLDLALLTVAYLRRWSSVAALALGGTVLLQAGWVFTMMEPSQVVIAFGVLALFAVLFAAFSLRFKVADESRGFWRLMQSAALLTPALFLIYFAGARSLDVNLVPVAAFMTLLTLGVGVVHRRRAEGEGALLMLASAAQVFVMGAAIAGRHDAELTSWPFAASILALIIASQLNHEWVPSPAPRSSALTHAATSTSLLWLLLQLAWCRAIEPDTLAPLTIATLVIGLSFLRLARVGLQGAWKPFIGAALALSLWIPLAWGADERGLHFDVVWSVGPLVTAAVLTLAFATWAKSKWADLAVVSLVTTGLVLQVLGRSLATGAPVEHLISAVLLAIIGVAAGLRAKSSASVLIVTLVAGLCWSLHPQPLDGDLMPWSTLFGITLVGGLLVHTVVLISGRAFLEKPWAGVAAAAVLPVSFLPMLLAWRAAWTNELQGALPIGLAVVSLGSAALARRRALGQNAVVWLIAAALGFISVAVPLQLDNEWWTISWALMAAAFLVLWQRVDHQGLKWLALTLLAFVAMRLLLNPEVLRYHLRGGLPFFNWLAYTYLVPALCFGVATWLLGKHELERARGWETGLYTSKIPLGASTTAISCALIVFAYLTLAVFDAFETDTYLTFSMRHEPARDLTLSLTWLVYAGTLLAIGMWRKSKAMRWMSLVFMLVSIGKAFLYDLGELKDLYRVASLMGLAVSLIVISLAYQRFVFRRTEGTSA